MRNFWRTRRTWATLLGLVGLAGLTFMGGLAVVTLWPQVGAQGAEVLRNLMGDAAVARMETVVSQAQDTAHHLEYQSGLAKPQAPWQPDPTHTPSPAEEPNDTNAGSAPVAHPTPTPQDSAPAPLEPLGSFEGEGRWQPYLYDPSGAAVAYRTFLQPDPDRAYAVVAVVAFDLRKTRLHFVLGSEEPKSTQTFPRSGTIPLADYKSGRLIAAFNGGFKTRHGNFGAMVNGLTAVPPRRAMGTVAIYKDGRVRLGVWGQDILWTNDLEAWRQNGPLLVASGAVNPHSLDVAPQDWGYTINGATAVWRSALGLSADEQTLYYLAGPSLTLDMLARAVADAGAANAIQLDINDYWVHFEAIRAEGEKLQATPLLTAMRQSTQRYLTGFSRDFFYVTLGPSAALLPLPGE